jgi:hypothetical protein
MPITWRHRIVRVLDDESSIHQAVLRLVEDGWIYVAGTDSEPGMTDLVFRRAAAKRAWA